MSDPHTTSDGSAVNADEDAATERALQQADEVTGDPAHGGRPVAPAGGVGPDGMPLDRGAELAALAQLSSHLGGRLEDLRSTFLQVLDSFALDITGRISAVEAAVRSQAQDPASARELGDELDDMLDLLDDLRVKPRKGRRRDLKQIAALVKALEGITDDWK